MCPRDHTFKTPMCKKYCEYGYGKRYNRDKFFAKGAYMLPQNEALIQSQIMRKGPVQAAFVVYEDFSSYKSGIYVVSRYLTFYVHPTVPETRCSLQPTL
ncbi:unnamed protein product [Haemonchus placei]|uniref:Pept_C1 domain-containing protein n=1 Tax=Haemonchus placei TaxID=6290 RepID=A0A0N4XBP9_HAEPC|nr:unnamed protein product [Haemonchus placei]